MRVYHFVSRRFGIDDLRKRRLKIAQIDDLNDPFELRGFGASDPTIRAAFEKVRQELAVSRGMLCFSANWTNPVQWSHYAEKHRGIAFGFDVPDSLLTAVKYSSKRIEPDIRLLLAGGQDAMELMLRGLTTKFSHWRYEREHRAMVNLDDRDLKTGLYFADFSDDLVLREIIVGEDSNISRCELSTALGSLRNDVDVTKARLAFRSFKVVRQRATHLWQ